MQGKRTTEWTVSRGVMAIAGSFILLSVTLAYTWTEWALLFTLFVGANLLQASFTGFCPAAMILRKLGFKEG
jgi:hypothetical protein